MHSNQPSMPWGRSSGAGIHGHDIARPAEFLLDASGSVRWVNLTEDLRVRARPEQMIAAAKALP
jgi:hypothetical protein